MKVKLKLLKGSEAGKEIKIPTPKCLIGRGEDCHLRPKSDAISRRHCVIYLKEGELLVRDLKSRNGTLVNGERLTEDRVLKSGDTLQVGPLAFEVVVDHSLGGEKKPKVSSVKEAAARTTSSGKDTVQLNDGDISDWLAEADEEERARRRVAPETRQLKLDETDQLSVQKRLEKRSETQADEDAEETPTGETEQTPPVPFGKTKGKKTFGKLPQRPEETPKNSRDAAAEMLKKFFNKR
ncbi:MAG: FHA domain-containing protein [Candidatus Anammoximicrobium sp.]|nr:FHA domain-containing protein [Candidatus Anammoximicrobium sp.]